MKDVVYVGVQMSDSVAFSPSSPFQSLLFFKIRLIAQPNLELTV